MPSRWLNNRDTEVPEGEPPLSYTCPVCEEFHHCANCNDEDPRTPEQRDSDARVLQAHEAGELFPRRAVDETVRELARSRKRIMRDLAKRLGMTLPDLRNHPDYWKLRGELERRDNLAYKKLRGDHLTLDEKQLLERLNRWVKACMLPREGLPYDVKKVIEELLDR